MRALDLYFPWYSIGPYPKSTCIALTLTQNYPPLLTKRDPPTAT